MSRHLTNSSCQSEEIRNNLYGYSEQFLKRTNDSNISFHIDTKRTFDAFCLLFTFFQYYNNKEHQSAISVRALVQCTGYHNRPVLNLLYVTAHPTIEIFALE